MTETVLLDVLDGVYTATDDRRLSVLISLDLSAAFDIGDNSLLIECLTSEFRDTDAPLDWLRFYLGDREQFVKIGQHQSDTVQPQRQCSTAASTWPTAVRHIL